jgi:hypothetical protein
VAEQYQLELDGPRLAKQLTVVRDVMLSASDCAFAANGADGWKTLEEIAKITSYPPASVSADLRHLRKKQNGGYTVEKRRRGDRSSGLWEYRVSRKQEKAA